MSWQDPDHTWTAAEVIPAGSLVGFWLLEHLEEVPRHAHEFYELSLVLRGSGYHVDATGEQPVEAGTAILVAPPVTHAFRSCTNMLVYNCFFRAELTEFELMWALRDASLGALLGSIPSLRSGTDAAPVVVTLDDASLRACTAEFEAIRSCGPAERSRAVEIGHLLLALDIVASARASAVPAAQAPGASATLPVASATLPVATALELMNGDMARQWTLAELSTRSLVGPFSLSHQFKAQIGCSPIAYLNQLRAERAASLLAGTGEAISAIGATVGWPDPSQFSRRFRQVFGLSPRAYRARHLGSAGYRVDAPEWPGNLTVDGTLDSGAGD